MLNYLTRGGICVILPFMIDQDIHRNLIIYNTPDYTPLVLVDRV